MEHFLKMDIRLEDNWFAPAFLYIILLAFGYDTFSGNSNFNGFPLIYRVMEQMLTT